MVYCEFKIMILTIPTSAEVLITIFYKARMVPKMISVTFKLKYLLKC